MIDNLEPLEPLSGLGPELSLEYTVAWDSDDHELVSFIVQKLKEGHF
jgi:hypothetical protein